MLTKNTVKVEGSCGHHYDSDDTKHIQQVRRDEARGHVDTIPYVSLACPKCRRPKPIGTTFDDFEGANW